MRIRENRSSGLLLATALVVGCALPMAGATDAASILPSEIAQASLTPSRPAAKHQRHAAHLATGRAAIAKVAPTAAKAVAPQPSARRDAMDIPPSVANANAQLTTTQAARNAMPLHAEPDVGSANADGPAVVQGQPPGPDAPVATSLTMHSVEQLAAVSQAVVSRADDAARGMQASLIGSICIGIGALLTMASAARLYLIS